MTEKNKTLSYFDEKKKKQIWRNAPKEVNNFIEETIESRYFDRETEKSRY